MWVIFSGRLKRDLICDLQLQNIVLEQAQNAQTLKQLFNRLFYFSVTVSDQIQEMVDKSSQQVLGLEKASQQVLGLTTGLYVILGLCGLILLLFFVIKHFRQVNSMTHLYIILQITDQFINFLLKELVRLYSIINQECQT